MRLSDVNFRREAWWLILAATLVPVLGMTAAWFWPWLATLL
jgi:hypothetical protein